MSDLIDRQALLEKKIRIPIARIVTEDKIIYRDVVFVKDIEALPPATPERKKGKWVGKEQFANSPEYYSWQCSVCGCVLEDPTMDKPYPFCPNCGADMRGEQE